MIILGNSHEKGRRTVSVAVETVEVIVFVDTVIEVVICGAVTLVDAVRGRFLGYRKVPDVLRRRDGTNSCSDRLCSNR